MPPDLKLEWFWGEGGGVRIEILSLIPNVQINNLIPTLFHESFNYLNQHCTLGKISAVTKVIPQESMDFMWFKLPENNS